MDETANQIEAHIDRTRERLGSNLRELEDKVEAATDWRQHFRERPRLFLGVAFVGGAILATTLLPLAPRRVRPDDNGIRRLVRDGSSARGQTLELWNNVKGALIGVASTRIKDYIGELLPGFDEHYRRAEQRAGASNPATVEFGRPTA
jgi:hypothetical protein